MADMVAAIAIIAKDKDNSFFILDYRSFLGIFFGDTLESKIP
jgi:hypothetical protein